MMERKKVSKIREQRGMTLIELIVGMVLLSLVLLGLIPVLSMVMKGNVRDRWDTLATQRAEEFIEIVKRVASTSTGYETGDTNDSGTIETANYREIQLGPDNTYPDPFNPIILSTGAAGVRGNRKYKVVTTVVGVSSYKTVTVFVESIDSSLLRTVTLETIIAKP